MLERRNPVMNLNFKFVVSLLMITFSSTMLGVGISTQRLHTIILFSILTLVWTVISFISMQVIVRNSILDIAIDRLNEDIKKTQAYIKAIEQIDNETEPTITKKENK